MGAASTETTPLRNPHAVPSPACGGSGRRPGGGMGRNGRAPPSACRHLPPLRRGRIRWEALTLECADAVPSPACGASGRSPGGGMGRNGEVSLSACRPLPPLRREWVGRNAVASSASPRESGFSRDSPPPHNVGESSPSIARRTILIGAKPCCMKLSWNRCSVKALPCFASTSERSFRISSLPRV